MKIVAYETARVTCLFPLEEVLPLIGTVDRVIVDGIKNKYKFLKVPDLATEDAAKNGYKFENGQFKFQGEICRITDFAIYRDGLVINAAKTDVAEAFLDEVIELAQKEFSFRDFVTRPRRYFQSQLVIELSKSPERLVRSLDQITRAISKPLAGIYDVDVPMRLARIDFDFDKTTKTVPAPATVQRFILERRVGVSYDKERYFSAAPMRTAEHLQVLEEIEALIE